MCDGSEGSRKSKTSRRLEGQWRVRYSAVELRRLFRSHEGVDPALYLAGAGPTSGPFGLACMDRPGARPATDRRVPLVVERVVGDVVLEEVVPDVLARPRHE